MTSLLPKNSTKLERCLEAAVREELEGLSSHLDFSLLLDPENCPESFLPLLAWANRVIVWDREILATGDKLSRKRELVANFPAVRALRGSRAAIDMALKSLGVKAVYRPWFEKSPQGKPFSCDIEIHNLENEPVSADVRERILRVIDALKPLRTAVNLRIIFDTTFKETVGLSFEIQSIKYLRFSA